MGIRKFTLAALIAAAVASPMAVSAASAAPVVAKAPSYATYIQTCDGTFTPAPRTFKFDCSKRAGTVVNIRWSGWGKATAVGKGTYVVKKGKKTYKYSVRLVVSQREQQEHNTAEYGQMSIRFLGKKPAGMERSFIQMLNHEV